MDSDQEKAGNYVMVVEDDEFYSKIFQAKIEEAGLKVKTFLSASEALEFAKKIQPKLIVSDLIMPGIDGFKFIKMIKENDSLKSIPIMAFSNLRQEEDIAEVKKMGAIDYVVKTEVSQAEAIDRIVKCYKAS